jgi:hypothetical protein
LVIGLGFVALSDASLASADELGAPCESFDAEASAASVIVLESLDSGGEIAP